MHEAPLDADTARLRLFFSTATPVPMFERKLAHCSQRPHFLFRRDLGCGRRYKVAQDEHMNSCIEMYVAQTAAAATSGDDDAPAVGSSIDSSSSSSSSSKTFFQVMMPSAHRGELNGARKGGRPAQVYVYPNPELEAALVEVETRRLIACGEHAGTPLTTPKGHVVYGDFVAAEKSPVGVPFYDTGMNPDNCEWASLVFALRPGSPYRAASPEEADVFVYFPTSYRAPFVSRYTPADRVFLNAAPRQKSPSLGPEEQLHLRKLCEFIAGLNASTVRRLMPHANNSNFRRHFIVADTSGSKMCADRPPFLARLLQHDVRHEYGVPTVGPIHADGESSRAQDPWGRAHKRKLLVSFVGSTRGTPRNARLRALLVEACGAAGAATCVAAAARTTAENLALKWNSTFCLEPGGYSALRKSAVDSMQAGCVPVFFLPHATLRGLWPLHWAEWRDDAVISIDLSRRGFAGAIHPPGLVSSLDAPPPDSAGVGTRSAAAWVIDLLAAIPADRVRSLQRALAGHARAVSYGVGHVAGDAIDRTFMGLLAVALRRAARDRERAPIPAWAELTDETWLHDDDDIFSDPRPGPPDQGETGDAPGRAFEPWIKAKESMARDIMRQTAAQKLSMRAGAGAGAAAAAANGDDDPSAKSFLEVMISRAKKLESPRRLNAQTGLIELQGFSRHIDVNDVVIDKFIEMGNQGRVFQGRYRGVDVAIKVIKDGRIAHGAIPDMELSAMEQVRGSRLVRFYGVGESDHHPHVSVPSFDSDKQRGHHFSFVVEELMTEGSLEDLLDNKSQFEAQAYEGDEEVWPWRERLAVLADVAEGMAQMHAKRFIHRDLKPGNVLFGRGGRCKVGDFGSVATHDHFDVARAASVEERRAQLQVFLTWRGVGGTPAYMSPEIIAAARLTERAQVLNETADGVAPNIVLPENITGRRPLGIWHAPDAYAFGIVLWEVLTLSDPWFHTVNTTREAVRDMWAGVQRGWRPVVPEAAVAAAPDGFVPLMRELWAQDPVARPTFAEALTRLRGMLQKTLEAQSEHEDDDPAEKLALLIQSRSGRKRTIAKRAKRRRRRRLGWHVHVPHVHVPIHIHHPHHHHPHHPHCPHWAGWGGCPSTDLFCGAHFFLRALFPSSHVLRAVFPAYSFPRYYYRT